MKQRALIELDLLLDTRYGTLFRMNPEFAVKFAESPEYRTRLHDKFDKLSNGVIDIEQYESLYKNRDVNTLLHSRITDFLYILKKDVEDIYPRIGRGVDVTDIEIFVNYHPYELTQDEVELIKRCVSRYIPYYAKVEMISIKPEELTPQVIDHSYEMFAYYNHEDWLAHHGDALAKKQIPNNVLITPMLSTSGVIPEPDPEIRDPFLARSACLVRWIALQWVPVEYVCWNPFVFKKIEEMRQSSTAT